jgi:hypothetical protein
MIRPSENIDKMLAKMEVNILNLTVKNSTNIVDNLKN